MQAARSVASLVRHAGGAASEAILVAAVVGLIALVLAPVYGPARFMTGSEQAAAAKVADSIWVNELGGPTARTGATLSYTETFTAGYTTRAAEPWGFAQCWANDSTVLGTPNQGTYSPGEVIWSEYRSLYPGGPVPSAFQLTDPIQHLWLGGGADCTLSLLKFSGGYSRQTVLATTLFVVEP